MRDHFGGRFICNITTKMMHSDNKGVVYWIKIRTFLTMSDSDSTGSAYPSANHRSSKVEDLSPPQSPPINHNRGGPHSYQLSYNTKLLGVQQLSQTSLLAKDCRC